MKTSIIIILTICSLAIYAQDSIPSFAPDRPGQTTGTYVVPKGYFHIESGLSYSKTKILPYESSNFQYNTSLLRYGLFDNFEVRLSTGYDAYNAKYTYFHTLTYSNNSFAPLTAGMKTNIYKGNKYMPEISFMSQLSWPYFGNSEEQKDLLYPLFAFCFGYSLNDYISIGYNFGLTWNVYTANDIGLVTSGFYSLAFVVAPFDKFSFFIEPYGSFDRLENPDHNIDFGVSYLILDNLQVDVYTIPDLKDSDTKDFYIAGGFSWRLPK